MTTSTIDVADYNRDVEVVIEIVNTWFPALDGEDIEDFAAEVIDAISARWAEQ
jgi:hypothetical protein